MDVLDDLLDYSMVAIGQLCVLIKFDFCLKLNSKDYHSCKEFVRLVHSGNWAPIVVSLPSLSSLFC